MSHPLRSSSGLQSVPNNAKMHYNYANLQRDNQDYDTATRHYNQAIRWEAVADYVDTVILCGPRKTPRLGKVSYYFTQNWW